jgi:AraC-like DNA-binding protein
MVEVRTPRRTKPRADRREIFPRILNPMTYESPAVRCQGDLNELLHRLVPAPQLNPNNLDQRIAKLMQFIDNHDGRVGWNLKQARTELKLDISAAYAARLFKLFIGLGVREYAKAKRLSAAAKLLTTTDLSVKAIAAEFGYRSPPDFTRRFKEQFHLSPIDFRRRALCEASTSELLLSPRKPRSVMASRTLRRTA